MAIRLAKNEPTNPFHEVETINEKTSSRNNAIGAWNKVKGTPIGEWEISFLSTKITKNNETQQLFKEGKIKDILLIVSCSWNRPKFPEEIN